MDFKERPKKFHPPPESARNSYAPRRKRTNKRKKNDFNLDLEEETDRFTEKFRLVNEIKSLKDEVSQYNSYYAQQIIKFEEDQAKEIRYQNKYKPEQCRKLIEQKDLPFKVIELQGKVDEIDQQITFFNSLFTEDKLNQLGFDVEEQKKDIVHLKAMIQDFNFDSELIYSSKQWEEVEKREKEMNTMNNTIRSYNIELKCLKKEGKKLKKDAEILISEEDVIEKNKKELAKFKRRYNSIMIKKDQKIQELMNVKREINTRFQISNRYIENEKKPRDSLIESINTKENSKRNCSYFRENQEKFENKYGEDSTIFQMTQNRSILNDYSDSEVC